MENNMSLKAKSRKIFRGKVVSDKMKNTVVVAVSRFVKVPKYGKYIEVTRRFKADDKGNTKKIGETVDIVPCKPISKDKRFKVI